MKKPIAKPVQKKQTAAPKPKDVVVESDSTIQRTRPEDRIEKESTQATPEVLPPQPTTQVEDGSIPRSAPNHPERHAP